MSCVIPYSIDQMHWYSSCRFTSLSCMVDPDDPVGQLQLIVMWTLGCHKAELVQL